MQVNQKEFTGSNAIIKKYIQERQILELSSFCNNSASKVCTVSYVDITV
jgi:hypothetical protein